MDAIGGHNVSESLESKRPHVFFSYVEDRSNIYTKQA
jgi:hypothetical protein